jgi:hypothetical protein
MRRYLEQKVLSAYEEELEAAGTQPPEQTVV